jgi:hypothetical protein
MRVLWLYLTHRSQNKGTTKRSQVDVTQNCNIQNASYEEGGMVMCKKNKKMRREKLRREAGYAYKGYHKNK